MNRRAYGHAMVALLGLGTIDLAALNLLAIPALFEPDVTEISSATDVPVRGVPVDPIEAPTPQPTAAMVPVPAATPATSAPAAAAPATVAPAAATEPAPAPTREPPAARPATATEAQTVLFSRGAWWIRPSKRRALREALAGLGPNAVIEVDGHADFTGPNDVNQRISERRAAAVFDLLVRSGVDPARIHKRAHGENEPSGTGQDRRVEIVIRGEP